MVKQKIFAVYFSRLAQQHLKEIYDYIGAGSPKNALAVSQKIVVLSKSLSRLPFRFEECEQLKTKTGIYRKATCLSYKIIYRVKQSRVEILAIFHSSQNPKKTKLFRKG